MSRSCWLVLLAVGWLVCAAVLGCSDPPGIVVVLVPDDAGPPAVVDCSAVSVGTLCNSAGHTCTPDGRCAPYDWWVQCGLGPECPDLICQMAVCVNERCMRWYEADGTSCFGDSGQCSGGECKVEAPHP